MQAVWWQSEMLWSPGQWGTVGNSGEEGRMESSACLSGQRYQRDSPRQQGQWQKQADENEVAATANTG